jgi:intracellular sulfur oxidation DsrE/DsrF family protein
MSLLKEEFDLLLSHTDFDERTIISIKEMQESLKLYKYLLNKTTIDNISQLLRLANHIKIELKMKNVEIELLKDENEILRNRISKIKHQELTEKELI